MYSRRASRIREERFTRARLAAPFVARSNSESNTTWMVSTLWRILHNQTHSQPAAKQYYLPLSASFEELPIMAAGVIIRVDLCRCRARSCLSPVTRNPAGPASASASK